jgi:DNA polymerase III epsilon subunit-like protein
MKNILFLDTETTGLPLNMSATYTDTENWPRLVSIAWQICNERGELLREFSTIVYPEHNTKSNEYALAKHGITHEEQIRAGAPIEGALNLLYYEIARTELVVCHNVAFDQPVVFAEMWRLGITPPTTDFYCTKEVGTDLCKIPKQTSYYQNSSQYKWPSLDELHQFLFNEPIAGREMFHNAITDVRATARCYFEMQKRLSHTHATIL